MNKKLYVKLLVIISFFTVIIVNILSFVMPINNNNVAQIAAYYPNYFTPSNFSYIIWIVIYLLLAAFTYYQYKTPRDSLIDDESMYLIRTGFIVYCILNFVWMFSWLFDYLALSGLASLMAVNFLGHICRKIYKSDLSDKDRIFVKLPFGILYGWICIATVSNIVILFYSIGWKDPGYHTVCAILTFIIVAAFTIAQTFRNKDIAFGLTVIWSYIGTLVKHIAGEELDHPYPYVVPFLIICIVLMSGCIVYLVFLDKIVRKNWY